MNLCETCFNSKIMMYRFLPRIYRCYIYKTIDGKVPVGNCDNYKPNLKIIRKDKMKKLLGEKMNKACNSNTKHEHECSHKDCVCGGYNASNPKKNLKHNSTKKKLSYRILKKFFRNKEEK